MFNILTDRFIRYSSPSGVSCASLPEILVLCAADGIDDFVALRPHQRASWHMLLVQLGAIAAYRAGTMPRSAAEWEKALLSLTGDRTAWDLVGEDDTRPAFLQVAMSIPYDKSEPTCDSIDLPITSRQHMLKAGIAADAQPDDWLFALVSLQTTQGVYGRGGYGVSRMNGGLSSRPFLGLAPAGGFGAHVMRDIHRMIAGRAGLIDTIGVREDGVDLLWLEPWDGTTQIRIQDLAPWYVEICRLLRLRIVDGSIMAVRAGSKVSRVLQDGLNGVTGDHWCPVNIAAAKSWTPDARGFTAEVLCHLLFPVNNEQKFLLPPALACDPGEAGLTLVCRALVRGQGVTEGYHERRVPFGKKLISFLGSRAGQDRLGIEATRHLREIGEIEKAMKFGIGRFVAGGDPDVKPNPDRVALLAKAPVDAFRRLADAAFFDRIEERLEDPGSRIPQLAAMTRDGAQVLELALETMPGSSQRRLKAIHQALGAFHGLVAKQGSEIGAVMDEIRAVRKLQAGMAEAEQEMQDE